MKCKICYVYLIIFLTGFFLAGCSTTPPARVVTKEKVVVVKVPDMLLEECKATTPPAKEVYIESSKEERLKKLSEYSMYLIKDVYTCNAKIKKIKEHQDRETAILESKNE